MPRACLLAVVGPAALVLSASQSLKYLRPSQRNLHPLALPVHLEDLILQLLPPQQLLPVPSLVSVVRVNELQDPVLSHVAQPGQRVLPHQRSPLHQQPSSPQRPQPAPRALKVALTSLLGKRLVGEARRRGSEEEGEGGGERGVGGSALSSHDEHDERQQPQARHSCG
eukprot:519669-Hanusia_phi.AAC.3